MLGTRCTYYVPSYLPPLHPGNFYLITLSADGTAQLPLLYWARPCNCYPACVCQMLSNGTANLFHLYSAIHQWPAMYIKSWLVDELYMHTIYTANRQMCVSNPLIMEQNLLTIINTCTVLQWGKCNVQPSYTVD